MVPGSAGEKTQRLGREGFFLRLRGGLRGPSEVSNASGVEGPAGPGAAFVFLSSEKRRHSYQV